MTAVTVQEAASILSQKFLLEEGVAGVSHRGMGSELVVYVESPEVAERVPGTLMGHPVRTIVSGRFQALSVPQLDKTRKWRPCPGGVSVGHIAVTAGTLGARVYDSATGARLFLSNNHVIAASNSGKPGDPILQPGAMDGGLDPADRFGVLERFVPLRPPPDSNLVDAAVGRPLDPDMLSDEVLGVGVVESMQEPAVGMRIAKSGRNCYTESIISDTHATIKVYGYPWEYSVFEDQIIAGYMASPGDSGSLAVNPDTRAAVGLAFAGSEEFTALNKIGNVARLLGVSFAPGPTPPIRPRLAARPAAFIPAIVLGTVILGASWIE